MKQESIQKEKLPEGWKIVELKDVCVKIDAGTWGNEPAKDNSHPVLRSNNIQDGKLDLSDLAFRSISQKDKENKLLEEGDIIITKSSGSSHLIGKNILFEKIDNRDYFFANFLERLKPNKNIICPKFLYYYLNSPIAKNIIDSMHSTTSGLRNLNIKIYVKQKIILPLILVQQQIVSKLDIQMAQIDMMKKETKKEKEASDIMLFSLLERFFPTKINSSLPKGWKWGKLSEATDNWKDDIVSGPFGSNLVVADYRTSGIPIVRLQNIQRLQFLDKDIKFITEEKAEELKRHSFKNGDLILAKLGDPLGKTCTVPKTLKEGIIVADVVRISISKKNNSKYFEYALNSNLVTKQLTSKIIGSTRPRVNLDDVRDIIIPLSDKTSQDNVVRILDSVKEKCNIINENINQKVFAISQLPLSILNEIFGKYKISEA